MKHTIRKVNSRLETVSVNLLDENAVFVVAVGMETEIIQASIVHRDFHNVTIL